MKEDRYEFVYSTKTKARKTIVYYAATQAAAVRRFRKNIRSVGPFGVYMNCEGFGIWLGLHQGEKRTSQDA